jgi:hypothetical protein
MGPQHFASPTSSNYFVGSCHRFEHSRWLPSPLSRYYVISVMPRMLVWRQVRRWVVQWKRGEVNEKRVCVCVCVCVCVWKPDATGRKWLLNCTCNYIAFIQMITWNLSNLRPSFFRSLSADKFFFFTFSTFPVVPARRFANGMTTQCSQLWESRVCLCRKPLCLYDTFFDLLTLFRRFWEMFRERHDNNVIHVSHTGNYMLHAQGSETLQTFTFRLLKGKQRTSVTFQTDGNIPISLHVFAFLLIVQQNISFIHNAAFFLHVCAFA